MIRGLTLIMFLAIRNPQTPFGVGNADMVGLSMAYEQIPLGFPQPVGIKTAS